MSDTTRARAHDEEQPRGQGGAWRRRWQKMKTPMQVIVGQLIGWALRNGSGSPVAGCQMAILRTEGERRRL